MVGVKVELIALESDLVLDFQRVVVAIRTEHDLSVVKGENRVEVGVVVVGDLLQRVREQVVDVDVGLAHACGGKDDFTALMCV